MSNITQINISLFFSNLNFVILDVQISHLDRSLSEMIYRLQIRWLSIILTVLFNSSGWSPTLLFFDLSNFSSLKPQTHTYIEQSSANRILWANRACNQGGYVLNLNFCCSLVDTRSVSVFVLFLWRKPKISPEGVWSESGTSSKPSGDDWGEPTTKKGVDTNFRHPQMSLVVGGQAHPVKLSRRVVDPPRFSESVQRIRRTYEPSEICT